MPTYMARSATKYATIQPHCTRSSTKNGSSHSVYCGECTLCSSRKPHSIAALTPTHGKVPSRRHRHQPTAHAATNDRTTSAGETRSTAAWKTVFVVSEYGRKPQYQMEFVVCRPCGSPGT